MSVVALTGSTPEEATPEGVVVLTQCCDLANGKGEALVAKVVQLADQKLAEARSGITARFVPVGPAGEAAFADLGVVAGMRLGDLVGLPHQSMGDEARRQFQERLTRRFGRFAFPDEIQAALRVLRNALRRAGRSEAATRVLRTRVKAIRIRLHAGTTPWTELEIYVVVGKNELPSMDGVEPGEGSAVSGAADNKLRTGTRLQQLLSDLDAAPSASREAGRLWDEVAVALGSGVPVEARGGTISSAICSVVETGEFSFQDYLDSADLDVDDLSD